MQCSICYKEIPKQYTPEGVMYWDKGNNAEPVVKEGRCCDECNNTVVIPARMGLWE